MFGLKDSDAKQIVEIFQHNGLQPDQVFVFGSRAKGNYENGSDVDLVYRGEMISDQKRKVLGCLEEETFMPYKFDLLIYDKIENEELKKHIDRVGIKIINI